MRSRVPRVAYGVLVIVMSLMAAACATATSTVPTAAVPAETPADRAADADASDSASAFPTSSTTTPTPPPTPARDLRDDHLVINEVHYHPADDPDETNDVDDLEFVELYNPTDAPIDLSGYSIADAVEMTFEDVVLPAGEYLFVSPSAEASLAEYGVSPSAVYTSKLSNGGETIALLAADGTVIDAVTYFDQLPWPEAADGDGPSLDLIDAASDNNDATNWKPSISPTPGEVNSTAGTEPLPVVSQITLSPAQPEPSSSVTISAKVPSAAATLTYQVNFDDPVSEVMDIADGVASAIVPGQDAGTLVRYRIDTFEASAPAAEDTIELLGYVVADPSVTPPVPRIDWFMEPATFEDMIENHLFDNKLFPATVAYDGVVYDNVMVRPRGGDYRRTTFPKQSFEFEFPKGHDFIAPELVPYPVDQFALGSQFGDWTMGREETSWSIMNAETGQPVHSAQTYLAQNGDFYGVYRFTEKLDGQWRDAVGLDGGEFFKANGLGGWKHLDGWEVKTPKDGTADEINALGVRLRNDPAGAAKTAFLYETFDIPNVINYMAVSALIEHDDQTFQNFFVFKDTDGSGLYSVHPWDLDETFGPKILCWEKPMTDPLCLQNPLFDSVMAVPEFEAMYWQRMRTLVDKYLTPTLLEDRHDALIATIGTELADQEAVQWGRNPAYAMTDVFGWGIQERRDAFANEPRLRPAQPANPAIVINEILPSPNDGEAEVLELFNASDSPIDLSGWTIDGVDLKIPGGTVISPGGYVVFTDSIKLLRSSLRNSNAIIIEFGGGLKGAGEQLTLSNASGVVVDEVEYQTERPWPSLPDGFSLSLRSPDSDNGTADAWVPSNATRGTPGKANTP